MQHSRELVQRLSNNFNVSQRFLPENSSIEDLINALEAAISDLLDHDFGKLLNIFYRLDFNEHKVKEVLSGSSADLVAQDLAKLIIERELQKIKTRQQY